MWAVATSPGLIRNSNSWALGPLRHKLWNWHPQDDSATCWPLRTHELVCSSLTQLLWFKKQAPGLAFKKTTAAVWLLLGFPWNSLYIISYMFPINPFLQMWLEDLLLPENSCFDLKSIGNFSLRKKWWLREQSRICFKEFISPSQWFSPWLYLRITWGACNDSILRTPLILISNSLGMGPRLHIFSQVIPMYRWEWPP